MSEMYDKKACNPVKVEVISTPTNSGVAVVKEQIDIPLAKKKVVSLPEDVKSLLRSMGQDPESEEAVGYWNALPADVQDKMFSDFYANLEQQKPPSTQSKNTAQENVTVVEKDLDTVSPTENNSPQEHTAAVDTKKASEVPKYDASTYNKLTNGEKKQLYDIEYAKNKFLYENNPPKTEKDWEKYITDNPDIYKAGSESSGTFDKDSMMHLQAANLAGKTLSTFMEIVNSDDKKVAAQADEYYYDSLFGLLNGGEVTDVSDENLSNMTQAQKDKWTAMRAVCDDVNFEYRRVEAEKQGKSIEDIKSPNFCPDMAYKFYDSPENKGKTDPFKARIARHEYDIAKLQKKEPLSDVDKKTIEAKQLVLAETKKIYDSPYGQQLIKEGKIDIRDSQVDLVTEMMRNRGYKTTQEMLESRRDQIGQNSSDDAERNKAVFDEINVYYSNVVGKDPVKAEEIRQFIMADEGLRQHFVNSGDPFSILGNATNASELTNTELENVTAKNNDSINVVSTIAQNINIEKQADSFQKGTIESKNQAVIDKGTDVVHEYSNLENADKPTYEGMADRIAKGSSKTRIHHLNTNENVRAEWQNIGREQILITDDKAVHEAAKDSIPRLAEANQTEAFRIGTRAANDNLSKENAIGVLKGYSDIISKSSVNNQLDMHKDIMQSKFDEVLQHASSNIHKYDESVQAKAIKVTYDTGNQKAIEAVVLQLDKCSEKAVQAMATESAPHIAAVETKSRTEVAQQVADYKSEYNKYSKDEKVNAADQKIADIKEFLKASPQEQYKMLSKLPQSMQGEALTKICRYCPNMLAGLVKQGYGKQILTTPGMSSEVIYKVVNVMFASESTDKAEAAKYVTEHKTLFSETTTEHADEILEHSVLGKKKKPDTKSYSSKPEFIQQVLKPRMSAVYPDKQDLFYRA